MTVPAREELITETFVDLADTLVDDYDVIDLLHTLVERAAGILEAADAGILLPNASGSLEVVASTSERSHLISILQLRAEEGPCVDAYTTGKIVAVDNIASTYARWPTFATSAASVDYQSMYAIPMRLRNQTIGSMNLFSDRLGPMEPKDTAVAKALTDVATISILQERALRESDIAREQLQHALDSRVVIEQAKGVLAQTERVDMHEAFTLLRNRARHSGRRLSVVAQEIIDASAHRA
ncbi:GAF and ANTAR domain-containing protein [Herbiconiux sp. CPCC 203407]|uniref:GAF and ANTAR domain-containing protein n=1 Tax=Herbiconiux oxytropis TaxID=2970915 RepID=A0AA41XAI4_9MICO|nr:GAF and ANTAR domain-containing protein [Herbiconiux oxytropis]MCS5721022.1 GAF and ANTAR domain-containing protein [Herbiconiux oxytropis]MCS5724674.1 GAF and ANTAR domain-containing protein [Herbiconiux oxytropis]